jgi:hypothetical protein
MRNMTNNRAIVDGVNDTPIEPDPMSRGQHALFPMRLVLVSLVLVGYGLISLNWVRGSVQLRVLLVSGALLWLVLSGIEAILGLRHRERLEKSLIDEYKSTRDATKLVDYAEQLHINQSGRSLYPGDLVSRREFARRFRQLQVRPPQAIIEMFGEHETRWPQS